MTGETLLAFAAAIVGGALRVGVPFLFVSLGECLTEKSGRINLGLEGVLVLSAMAAFGGAWLSGSALVGVLCGAVLGGQPDRQRQGTGCRHRCRATIGGLLGARRREYQPEPVYRQPVYGRPVFIGYDASGRPLYRG